MTAHPRHLIRFHDNGAAATAVVLGLTVEEVATGAGPGYICTVSVTGDEFDAAFLEVFAGGKWQKVEFDHTTGIGFLIPQLPGEATIYPDGFYRATDGEQTYVFRLSALDGYRADPVTVEKTTDKLAYEVTKLIGVRIDIEDIDASTYKAVVRVVPGGTNVSVKHQFPYDEFAADIRVLSWHTAPTWSTSGSPATPVETPDDTAEEGASYVGASQPYYEAELVLNKGSGEDQYLQVWASFRSDSGSPYQMVPTAFFPWILRRNLGILRYSDSLTASTDDVDTSISVSDTTGLLADDYLRIGPEVIKVVSIDSSTELTVDRAQLGTTAVDHTVGTHDTDVWGHQTGRAYAAVLKVTAA